MHGQLDSMAQTYSIAQTQQCCVISTSMANATARALIQRFPKGVENTDLESTASTRILFKRMGVVKH